MSRGTIWGISLVIVALVTIVALITAFVLRAKLRTMPTYRCPAQVVEKWRRHVFRATSLYFVTIQFINGTQLQFDRIDMHQYASLSKGQHGIVYYSINPSNGNYIFRAIKPLPEAAQIYAVPAKLVKFVPVKLDYAADYLGTFQFDNGTTLRLKIFLCECPNPVVGERKTLHYQVVNDKSYFVSF